MPGQKPKCGCGCGKDYRISLQGKPPEYIRIPRAGGDDTGDDYPFLEGEDRHTMEVANVLFRWKNGCVFVWGLAGELPTADLNLDFQRHFIDIITTHPLWMRRTPKSQGTPQGKFLDTRDFFPDGMPTTRNVRMILVCAKQL